MYANLCNAYLNINFLPVGIYRVGTKAYPADFWEQTGEKSKKDGLDPFGGESGMPPKRSRPSLAMLGHLKN
jgi:hypothetical protein